MSLSDEKSLVIQVALTTNTYYMTNRDAVTLDGTTYDNTILSIGDVPHHGNLGNGEYEIGSVEIIINNGEEFQGSGYQYDPTDVWNNSVVTIKIWENETTFRFEDCTPYASGIIKNYQIEQDKIKFTVEATDRRDDQLIPGVVGIDQTSMSDGEARATWYKDGSQNLAHVSDYTIWDKGELVRLESPDGVVEYARIIEVVTDDYIRFYNDLSLHSSFSWSNTNIIEKAFRNIPEKFVGKVFPIQIGDLSKEQLGLFAKTFTTNELIGKQEIVTDYMKGDDLESIGAWESGLRRYFEGKSDNEYTIDTDSYNIIRFRTATTATLSMDITSTSDGVDQIYVSDYTQFNWVNEDDDNVDTVPELLTTSIIGINRELMQLVEEPYQNELYVERGYNGTDRTTHDAGDSIYQNANYSSKNLLSFTERFDATALTNIVYSDYRSTGYVLGKIKPSDLIVNNTKPGYAISNSDSEYWELDLRHPTNATQQVFVNFDIKFPLIEDDFKCSNMYLAYKVSYVSTAAVGNLDLGFVVFNPDGGATYSSIPYGDTTPDTDDQRDFVFQEVNLTSNDPEITINNWDSLTRDYYQITNRTSDYIAVKNNFNDTSNPLGDLYGGTPFLKSSLKDLNKKWKLSICAALISNAFTSMYVKTYHLGMWVDFYLNFTKHTVVAPLKAREIDAHVVAVTGAASPSSVGDVAENIVDVLALLLIRELGYYTAQSYTDLFTTNWSTVHDYTVNQSNYEVLSPLDPTPETAFSYGINDKQVKGWKFISWLASHFNLQIVKDYEGKIDIINLHEIYNNTPAGNEVKISEIIFLKDSGDREITIHQTGTDLIYNDIVVKYWRNNSTDEYSRAYTLPDSYTMVKSGVSIATARTNYYGGEKRTLTIESPFIYNEADARRLAEWKADDQAETHFWVDMNIDFYHYTDVNSLSSQYAVGDILYLTGEHGGISFDSNRKFYIQNIFFIDMGMKVKIQMKSVDPVSSFSQA